MLNKLAKIYQLHDNDDKCDFCYSTVNDCKKRFYVNKIKTSISDKRWITPLWKNLINRH